MGDFNHSGKYALHPSMSSTYHSVSRFYPMLSTRGNYPSFPEVGSETLPVDMGNVSSSERTRRCSLDSGRPCLQHGLAPRSYHYHAAFPPLSKLHSTSSTEETSASTTMASLPSCVSSEGSEDTSEDAQKFLQEMQSGAWTQSNSKVADSSRASSVKGESSECYSDVSRISVRRPHLSSDHITVKSTSFGDSDHPNQSSPSTSSSSTDKEVSKVNVGYGRNPDSNQENDPLELQGDDGSSNQDENEVEKIEVIEPTLEGTEWVRGSSAEIRWEVLDPSVRYVRIDVCNTCWLEPTVVARKTENNGYYRWRLVVWGLPIKDGYYINFYDASDTRMRIIGQSELFSIVK